MLKITKIDPFVSKIILRLIHKQSGLTDKEVDYINDLDDQEAFDILQKMLIKELIGE